MKCPVTADKQNALFSRMGAVLYAGNGLCHIESHEQTLRCYSLVCVFVSVCKCVAIESKIKVLFPPLFKHTF